MNMPPKRIGLVVEGIAGITAIPVLLQSCHLPLLRPVKFDGQPVECDDKKFREFVVCEIVPRVQSMITRRATIVIVIIDREARERCPGDFAQLVNHTIINALRSNRKYTGYPKITVVCADRQLENWLIADPQGIKTHKYIQKDLSSSIGANADSKDAEKLLNDAYVKGRSYHKTMDAHHLAGKVRVLEPVVRRRSKSLDKLLRECGVPSLR